MSATLIGQEGTRAVLLTTDSLLCHSPNHLSATRGENRFFSTRLLLDARTECGMVIIALNAYRITMRPVCCGNNYMRAQAREPSAPRSDTPRSISVEALGAEV